MRKLTFLFILASSIFLEFEHCHGQGYDFTGFFDSNVESFPEDKKIGPKLFKNGKTQKPDSGDREAMLMVKKGNTANHFTNFTGYFVGFEFYATKEAPINLQLYRLSRYTDEPNYLGYYELIAETGFFTATEGKKTRFFDLSLSLVREDVIVGVKYRKEGNPIPYRKDSDCSNVVLYSESRSVEGVTSIYEEVHFSEKKCHKYALRGILLKSDYAEMGCDMHIAPSDGVAFIQSHTDFGVAYYPNDYYKCWIIRAESKAEEVRVESAVFDLEKGERGKCVYDAARVYTLKWGSNPKRLRTKCGNNNIKGLSTDGENYMFLEFSTDDSYAYTGFYVGASSFQISLFDYTTVAIAVSVVGAVLIAVTIIIIVICYRKKHSKKKPELIVNEKEAVVESDKEDEEDDYMINKAPLSTTLPSFVNRSRLPTGGLMKPIQPTFVKPSESGKPLPLAAQRRGPFGRRDTVEFAPVAPALAQPVQPGPAPMPKQPPGAPKLANFVTAVMKPGSVTVQGGVVPGQPQAMVAAGIASQDAGLNKPMEPEVSSQAPDLSRFKSLWKKALIPGPARYIEPKEWTRPWARPLQTVVVKTPTQTPTQTPKPTPRSQVIPPPPAAAGPPIAPAAPPKLPPGFTPGAAPLVPPPKQSAQADAEGASVAYPQLFTVVKNLTAANDPVKARSMWKTAAAMLPGPANYLAPSQWQRPWAMTSNKNPRFKPKFTTVSPAIPQPPGPRKPGDGRSKSTDPKSHDTPPQEQRPRTTTPIKKSKVAPSPSPPPTDDNRGLLDSDSPRSSSASDSAHTSSSSGDTTEESTAAMLPKVHLTGSGSDKNQSEC